jgi:predicted nucleotidyltransferase
MNLDTIPETYLNDIKKASYLLKNEGCKSVFLFGSMVTGKIHRNSDIDIGIMGLPPKKFFKVYAYLDKELILWILIYIKIFMFFLIHWER